MQGCKHQLAAWKFGNPPKCMGCDSKMMTKYCYMCKRSFCSAHDPTPKVVEEKKVYSNHVLSYKDLNKLWETHLKKDSQKSTKGTDAYYPDGKSRPHIHWTKDDYIGSDSFNFVGSTPQKIHKKWVQQKEAAFSSKNWQLIDQRWIDQIRKLK